MGIKNFTKVFPLLEKNRVVFKDYKGKTIIIDVMIELYRSMLGISNRQTLTDKQGNPTIHISVLLCLILELYKAGVGQIWCFDNCRESGINKDKIDELKYRKSQRVKAQKEYLKITNELSNENELSDKSESSDSDIEFLQAEQKISTLKRRNVLLKKEKLNSLRKRTFVVKEWMINDIKFILDCFKITWIEAPATYESEHLAACLTKENIADAVFTTDADALLFGAKEIIKRDTRRSQKKGAKKYYKYNLKTLLKENKLSQTDFIKVGICLGNDFIKKGMPGIGSKTVLKKFKIVDKYLCSNFDSENISGDESDSDDYDSDDYDSDSSSGSESESESDIEKTRKKEVRRAFAQFTRVCPASSTFTSINKRSNFDISISLKSDNMKRLLNWLGKEKNYNTILRRKIIQKAIDFREGKKKSVVRKKKNIMLKKKIRRSIAVRT